MGRLQHKSNGLLATCSITITNKQNHKVIDYDWNYHDCICLETSSEGKQNPFAWCAFSIFRTIYDKSECNKRNYKSL